MKFGLRIRSMALLAAALAGVLGASRSEAATIIAASCQRDAVNAAVSSASDGDTVLIPNGSCSWTTGVSTTKQIAIRAQNYTPTPGGNTSRSVTITNNSSSPLFTFTTGNNFHVALSGIRFNEGSTMVNHLHVQGSGSKVALISDNYFEVRQRNGNAQTIAAVYWEAQGGVLWNNRFVGLGPGPGGQPNPDGASFYINTPNRVWNSPGTMGTRDSNGSINIYFEDNSFKNLSQCADVDDHGRAVFRHNDFDGLSGLTHGFTSAWGGRHLEYYDNNFHVSQDGVNLAGRYIWMRAGTAAFFNNNVEQENRGYGLPQLVQLTVEGGGTYPKPRAIGRGWEGSDVSDPVYVWNNSGPGASSVGNNTPSLIQENRDYYVNKGAKPGYTPYTYPHPARTGGSPSSGPSAPTNLRIVAMMLWNQLFTGVSLESFWSTTR